MEKNIARKRSGRAKEDSEEMQRLFRFEYGSSHTEGRTNRNTASKKYRKSKDRGVIQVNPVASFFYNHLSFLRRSRYPFFYNNITSKKLLKPASSNVIVRPILLEMELIRQSYGSPRYLLKSINSAVFFSFRPLVTFSAWG